MSDQHDASTTEIVADERQLDVERRKARSRRAIRAVTAGSCAVLAALAAAAISGGVRVDRSADRLVRSGDLVEAYRSLRVLERLGDPRDAALSERIGRYEIDGAETGEPSLLGGGV